MDLLFNQHHIIYAARDTRNFDITLDDLDVALDAIEVLLGDGKLSNILEEFQNDHDVVLELWKLCHDIYTLLRNTSNETNGTRFVLFYAQVTPVYSKCAELLNANPETKETMEKHMVEFPLGPYEDEDEDEDEDIVDTEPQAKVQKT